MSNITEGTRRNIIVGCVVLSVALAAMLGWITRGMFDATRPAPAYAEATHVTVFRNVDGTPDIVMFCIDIHGFWSTLGDNPRRVERHYEIDDTICNLDPEPKEGEDSPLPEPEPTR